MKIWTVTYNDDNGVPNTSVCTTKGDALKAQRDWLQAYVDDYPDVDFTKSNEEILEALREQAFYDSCTIEEHTLTLAGSMKVSVCTYMDHKFEVMLIDGDTGYEVMLEGTQELSVEDFDTINKLAPACVWTEYFTNAR